MKRNNNSTSDPTEEVPLNKLDLAAILKASLAISEQLLPEKLSRTFIQIAMQETGADKGYLLLLLENQLSITAEAKMNKVVEIETYNTLKVPDYNLLPTAVIQYVQSTNEKVIIDDVSRDKVFGTDKYFITNHPKSIACIPILKEKKLIGILYLENSLFTGVFTIEKVAELKILASQAAVSYENQILFHNLDLSKKTFQDIMDNTTAVVFVKTLDSRYLFINKEFEKLYKVSREKVINMSDYDIFPKEFAESFIAKDKLISETERSLTYEEKIPHEDGIHTYIIEKFPLRDPAGKLNAIGGIATDISDIKHLEESLRENQSRFNYVLAATQDSIYDWNIDTGRIWRNEQFEKLFGGPTGPNPEWWKNNIHPDDLTDVEAAREIAFSRHDQLWNKEYRFNRLNKGYANIIDRGFIIYNPQRQAIRIIGALMDITERKQFINDLERSLSLSRATLESTADGILVVDTLNQIVDYNEKFAEMWHIPNSLLQTKEDASVISFVLDQLKNPDSFISKVRELYASPEKESFDLLEFKDGRIFERYSKPQKTKEKTIGRVWSFRDVTEQKREEEEEKNRIIAVIERQSELLRLNSSISSLPLMEKLKEIIKSDGKTIKVERVSIQMFDADRISITSENIYVLSKSDYEPGISIFRKDYPRYFSELEINHIIDANNAEDDPRTSELTENYLEQYGITSIMNVPVKFKGKIVGIVCHEHVGPKRKWTYEEQTFATSIANLVSLALEIDEREKTENDLIKLNEELEERVATRTAELASSEEKFRAIIESANDSIISADKEGKIIYWNKSAVEMFGYSPDEAIGQPVTLIMPQQHREKHTAAFNRFLKTKEAHILGKGNIELSGLKKGGIEFPIELSLETWKSNNEDFFTAIIQDITEREKAEDELRQYEHFFNTTQDFACIANVQGYFEIINANFEKVLGYSKKELLENQFLNFVHPDDINSTQQEIEKLKAGAVTINFVNRYRKKDGSYLWLEWNTTPDSATGKIYAIARNITERKIAEAELKEKSEEIKQFNIFLNSILDNIPNMIFVKDAKDLRFVRLNKAGEDLLGYKKSDLIGKNDYDLFPKEQAEFFTAKDRDVLNKGGILDIPEEAIETKNGKRWLHTRKVVIKDEAGKALYLLGISWDITEQKKARLQ